MAREVMRATIKRVCWWGLMCCGYALGFIAGGRVMKSLFG